MSDKLFLGAYFYEDCPASGALMCAVLGVSVLSSMFQVSSLLLLDMGLVLEAGEWWRPFTGLLTVTHPDELILIMFVLYCSRSYEAARGTGAYLALLLEALLLCSLPALALGLWSYFEGYYLTHFACTYAGALATASLALNRNKWKATIHGRLTIGGNLGLGLVYALLCLSRFSLEALVFGLWSGAVGALAGFSVPPFYIPGLAARCGCRRRGRRSGASRGAGGRARGGDEGEGRVDARGEGQ